MGKIICPKYIYFQKVKGVGGVGCRLGFIYLYRTDPLFFFKKINPKSCLRKKDDLHPTLPTPSQFRANKY